MDFFFFFKAEQDPCEHHTVMRLNILHRVTHRTHSSLGEFVVTVKVMHLRAVIFSSAFA